jgi:hypothetical protein
MNQQQQQQQLRLTHMTATPHVACRLDGPLWMVAHDVTQQGALPNMTVGKLDVTAEPISWLNMTAAQRELARNFSVEPPLPMWLMYQCPYAPIGRPNTCYSRAQQVQDTRSTFLANERTLSKHSGATQVRTLLCTSAAAVPAAAGLAAVPALALRSLHVSNAGLTGDRDSSGTGRSSACSSRPASCRADAARLLSTPYRSATSSQTPSFCGSQCRTLSACWLK